MISGYILIGLVSTIVCILIWMFIDMAREKDPEAIRRMWDA